MSTRLRFLGATAFEVVAPEVRVLIDPFLSGNPVSPVGPDEIEAPDLILVTHADRGDVVSDTAAIAGRTGASVVCGADVRQLLIDEGLPATQIMASVWGVVVEVAGVIVRPVECHRWSTTTRSNGQVLTGSPLAYIFDAEPGVRIYHYGDTSVFDMRLLGSLYAPTVGLIGCSHPRGLPDEFAGAGVTLTGGLNPAEAALVAEMLGVRTAVACAYLEPDDQSERFVELLTGDGDLGGREALAPEPGEWVALEPAVGEPVG